MIPSQSIVRTTSHTAVFSLFVFNPWVKIPRVFKTTIWVIVVVLLPV